MAKQERDQTQERYVMVELSCAERRCDPCTYPNCQRFIRENGRKRVVSSRMFESPKPALAGDQHRQRYVLLELSCSELKCQPCTYPNCQRYEREIVKKKPFKVKVVELAADKDLKSLLAKPGKASEGRKR